MTEYESFLRSKMVSAPDRGVKIEDAQISSLLKPHQSAIVRWALRKGNAAIFAAFGLGKTFIQLEIARLIQQSFGGKFLIVAPLGVRQEFYRDAKKLGTPLSFARRFEQCRGDGIFLTNYETIRDSKMDPRKFIGCSLDEAAILRGFGSTKTFREFMRVFENAQVRYKFVATATPSPNEYIELLAYAAFLDVMDVSQAKTRFFKRDSTKADNLTLHKHKEREFWLWISSWAIFLQKPSDLGFSDDGYELPPLEVRWHEIPSDHTGAGHETNGQGRLVRSTAVGVTHAAKEKKDSMQARVERMVQIVRSENMGARTLEASAQNGDVQSLSTSVSTSALLQACRRNESASPDARVETLPSRIQPALVRGESVKTESEKSRELYEKPRKGTQGDQGATVEAIRSDGSRFPEDANRTKSSLQNLPTRDWSNEIGSSGGSRSQDENRQGSSLSGMQHVTRPFSGQSDNSLSGHHLSQFIVWCDRNDEQHKVDRTLADLGISYSSLYGAQDIDEREGLLQAWKDKKTEAFISKAVMYGAGVNLQQCSTAIFVGINFQFAAFLQAVKRIHRFLQERPVTIHLIYTEAEREVRRVLEEKWAKHNELVAQMSAIIREYGLATNALEQEFGRSLGVERKEISGQNWTMVHNDAVLEAAHTPDDHVSLILTSIPFSTQYEYSPSYNDFGHSESNEQFWEQMGFLIPELYRLLQPGRDCLIHVKDRIVPGGLSGVGFQTVYPFHCDAIRHFCRAGFAFIGQVTIVTDVVRENGQTYRLGWSEQCKDGSKMGWGMPEYLLGFRKPPSDTSRGYADVPVLKNKAEYSRHRWQVDAHGFHRSSGNRLLTKDDIRGMPHERIFKLFRSQALSTVYDYEEHVQLGEVLEVCAHCGHIHLGIRGDDDEGKVCGQAITTESVPGHFTGQAICQCPRYDSGLPKKFMLLQPPSWHPDVWTDVTRMRSLNSAQSAAGREMHLCPMQFDIAIRAITQRSQPGEIVLDPFAGIGTVPQQAVLLGRKGLGWELSERYFLDAVYYCESAEKKLAIPNLFDLMGSEDEIVLPA